MSVVLIERQIVGLLEEWASKGYPMTYGELLICMSDVSDMEIGEVVVELIRRGWVHGERDYFHPEIERLTLTARGRDEAAAGLWGGAENE